MIVTVRDDGDSIRVLLHSSDATISGRGGGPLNPKP